MKFQNRLSKKIRNQISNFATDLKEEAIKRGFINFETSIIIDDDEDEIVYFVYHNCYDLEICDIFENFASLKMDEHFFSRGIFNVCFTHDCEFQRNIEKLNIEKLIIEKNEKNEKLINEKNEKLINEELINEILNNEILSKINITLPQDQSSMDINNVNSKRTTVSSPMDFDAEINILNDLSLFSDIGRAA